MKYKTWISLLAAALLVGGMGITTAQAADHTAPARGGLLARLADRLDLTDDQRQQIKAVLADEKDTLKPLLAAMREARTNLRAAIQADDATETAVRAAAAKVGSAEGDLAVERMKLFAKISPILTADQRKQLTDLEARADEFVGRRIDQLGAVPGK